MPSDVERNSWKFPDPNPPEPESPSLGDALELLDATLSAKQREIDQLKEELRKRHRQLGCAVERNDLLTEELARRNQDIEDLKLTNLNLSRKIVEDRRTTKITICSRAHLHHPYVKCSECGSC